MTVGNRTLSYDPATYFVMSVDLPAVGALHPSGKGHPYLAVSLMLTPAIIASLLRVSDLTDMGALSIPAQELNGHCRVSEAMLVTRGNASN